MIGIDMLLTTVLGALIKAMASKALDRASEAEAGKRNLDHLESPVAMAAVGAAVHKARKEMIDQLHKEGIDLEDDVRQDVLAFLDNPELTKEIANHLLFRENPDFKRLRKFYLSGDEATGDRWKALKTPLFDFFESIEDYMLVDPDLGPLLKQTRKMHQLEAIEGGIETVAEISRKMARTLNSLDDRDRQRDDFWIELLMSHADQTLILSQQKGVLEQILVEQQRDRPLPLDSDLDPAEERYLRRLAEESDALPLASDDRGQHDGDVEVASLANVYVGLATRETPSFERLLDRLGVPGDDRPRVRKEMRGSDAQSTELELGEAHPDHVRHLKRGDEDAFEKHPLRPYAEDAEQLERAITALVTALEALADNDQLVLLGDPGSGKSTLVNHVAHTFAQARLDERCAWREITGELFDQPLFPIRVVLREWSSKWSQAEGEEAFYEALDALSTDIPRDRWLKRLDHENTLVLLDGLDEVPTAAGEKKVDRRRQLLKAVERFRISHPQCRVLVTCRVKPYTGEYRLRGWPSFELAQLDEPRIEHFCNRWYGEQERTGLMDSSEAQACRKRLLEAVRTRPVLGDMAGTPLLLTMLARVNARSHLPEGRVELYQECVEQLLWEWEKAKEVGGEGEPRKLDDLLQEPDPPLKRSDLERLLWELAFEVHGQSGDESVDLPTERLRAELAGIHPGDDDGWAWANRVIRLMRQRSGLLIASSDEVFSFPHRGFQEYLAARGLLLENNNPAVAASKAEQDVWWEVILLACGHLAGTGDFSPVQNIVQELIARQSPQTMKGARRILLAGQAWQEFGHHRRVGDLGEELHEKLPGLLIQAMQFRDLPAPQRHAAGLIASDFGDLPGDLDDFVALPEEWFGYPFKIGKYPVTNAQYRRFMEDGGYESGKGWISDEGLRVVGSRTEPGYWTDRNRNRETQPVVGVTWYEAEAYCKWLTAKLRVSGEISSDEMVRLPTFEERKKVAAGPEDRTFPWGDDEDVRFLNCEESKIGLASPVQMYPDGVTPEGVWDLSGNVWEWLHDRDEEKDFSAYILGGGAWYKNISLNTSDARDWHDADFVWFSYGFRVSVSPLLP